MKKFISLVVFLFMMINIMPASASGVSAPRDAANEIPQLVTGGDSGIERPVEVKTVGECPYPVYTPKIYAANVKDGSSDYGYRHLNTAQKQVYMLMKSACNSKSYNKQISISGYKITGSQLKQVFIYFRDDNPQFFWLDRRYTSYYVSGSPYASSFVVYSLYSLSSIGAIQAQINQAVAVYLNAVQGISDPFQKELILHDMIDNNISYNYSDMENENYHNIYGVFVKKTAVCEGYAKAFQYLLNLAGVDNIYITGIANGSGHAWNMVNLGGYYYEVDPTWDDPIDPSDSDFQIVSHEYFNITAQEISSDHTADSLASELYPLPACTATAAGYFVRKGYAYASASGFSGNAVSDILSQIGQGIYFIELKAGSAGTLQDMENSFSQNYYSILNAVNSKLPSDETISSFALGELSDNILIVSANRSINGVDKTRLAEKLIYSKLYFGKTGAFTSTSAGTLSVARSTAESADLGAGATQSQVGAAVSSLQSAINNLSLNNYAPVITIGSYNRNYTNKNITVTAATNKGILNTQSHTFTGNGSYTFSAWDVLGHKTYKMVTISNIDKAFPSITATIANGGYTGRNVTVTCSDSHLSGKTAYKNGIAVAWPAYGLFTAEGRYTIRAVDKAGNVSVYSFTIDKNIPVIKAFRTNGTQVVNNGVSLTDVTVTVGDTSLISKTVTRNGAALAWPAGGVFTQNGKYTVTAKDKLGRVSIFTFTVSKPVSVTTVKTVLGACLANVNEIFRII